MKLNSVSHGAEGFDVSQLPSVNQMLESQSAQARTEWALEHLDDSVVLSSSFGVQAAVMLHMITQYKP